MKNDLKDPVLQEVLADEVDKPPVRLVMSAVTLCFLSVLCCALAAGAALNFLTTDRGDNLYLGMANPQRTSYIKEQAQLLSSTGKQKDGSFRIPIQEAMQRIVEGQVPHP